MRNEQWIFYNNLSVFGQIKNIWIKKIIWRYLHQIQENWAFTTTSCVNSHMQEYRDKSEIYNYPTDSTLK